MPIPEPARYRPSNLTREQREQQMAAIYGVPMPNEQLSHDEIERMRHIIAQHDSNSKPVVTTDLNNPPRVPYHYQKFPMIVYHLGLSTPQKIVTVMVHSEDELTDALASGYTQEPPAFTEEREEPLSAQYQNEVARAESVLAEARRVHRKKTAAA